MTANGTGFALRVMRVFRGRRGCCMYDSVNMLKPMELHALQEEA